MQRQDYSVLGQDANVPWEDNHDGCSTLHPSSLDVGSPSDTGRVVVSDGQLLTEFSESFEYSIFSLERHGKQQERRWFWRVISGSRRMWMPRDITSFRASG